MNFRRTDLGNGLSEQQIGKLGTRLAKIFQRDKVHLGPDETNAVLQSGVDLGLTLPESPQIEPAAEIANISLPKWLRWLDRSPAQRLKDIEAGIRHSEED